jgi:DNA-binding transcriptional LysR family regulator
MFNLDLNLLTLFDTLYELRSVTKAAARLNLTQSAISHALRRLREAMGDPLFVRAAGGLQPTARAVEMAPGIRSGLAQLRGAMAPTAFAPATSTRSFTIATGSYFCALLIPELVARGRAIAPGVSFRVVPVDARILADLDESTVDLALGAFTKVPARLVGRSLFREDLVWIVSPQNPIGHGPVDYDHLAAQSRLAIGATRPFEPSKALFAEGGLEPQIVAEVVRAMVPELVGDECATVYETLTAVAIVERTDLVALVPRRIAQIGADSGRIVILETERPSEKIDLTMLWHGRFSNDAGLAWLREQIVEIAC